MEQVFDTPLVQLDFCPLGSCAQSLGEAFAGAAFYVGPVSTFAQLLPTDLQVGRFLRSHRQPAQSARAAARRSARSGRFLVLDECLKNFAKVLPLKLSLSISHP